MMSRSGFVLLLVLVCLSIGAPAEDYLSDDQRDRVNALVDAVSSSPTDASNLHERAPILYEWGNAFAQSRGQIPVELPIVTALGMTRDLEAAKGWQAFDLFDTHVHELALREREPAAIGSLTASPTTFTADSFASFDQVYEVGSRPVQIGGGFLIGKHAISNYPMYQVRDPSAPNFVSIRSSNPDVRFEPHVHRFAGQHGGFRVGRPLTVFRVAGAELEPGDRVTITYGDRREGSPGYRMQDFSNDRAAFPIYVDLDGSSRFLSLPIQAIKIIGGSIAGLHGFAPSIVKIGETFEISIRAEDAFANRAEGKIPAIDVMLNEAPYATIPAGTEAIATLNVRLDEPGVYRFKFRAGDIVGNANPILVQEDPSYRVFWGDTHGHSGFAEGVGSAKGFMEFARDDARLDFVTHSEHDIWLDDSEWQVLVDNVRQFNEEGRFITFLGYEWSQSTRGGGHHNVLFRTPADRLYAPVHVYPALSSLYHALRSQNDTADVLIIPHAHEAGEFRMNDPEMEHLVEIMSGHGNFEWFGVMYLQHGHRVGFTAASDDHLGHPGYSAPRGGAIAQRGGLGAVLASELTTDALFDGMKSLRAYATTGDRMIVDFRINGDGIGQTTAYADERTIEGRVIGTAPIEAIEVFKNSRKIWSSDTATSRPDGRDGRWRIAFESDSRPVHINDNPRGWRVWKGTLEVSGASVDDFELLEADNPLNQLTPISDKAGQYRFETRSRGNRSSISLHLSQVAEDASITVRLEPSVEGGGAPPLFRDPAKLPAFSDRMRLLDAINSSAVLEVEAPGYIDRIVLERWPPTPEKDVRFSFVDNERPRQGDYYFMRVRQTNNAMAWTSPIWVGGFDKK